MYKMLDGNYAAVEAMKLAKVKVIAAYPITPQSSISENSVTWWRTGPLTHSISAWSQNTLPCLHRGSSDGRGTRCDRNRIQRSGPYA